MPNYHRIAIQKAVVYLSSEEIHRLLMKDTHLFREALSRGKAFKRYEAKNAQYEKKFSEQEGQTLSKLSDAF